MKTSVHWPAVVIAALVRFVAGAIWTPLLFADAWTGYTGWTADQEAIAQSRMGVTFVAAFASYVVQGYVIATIVSARQATTATSGALTGFWVWLGTAAVLLLQDSLFELRPFGLFAIKAGYELKSLVLMGALLAAWQKKTPFEPANV